MCTETEDQIIDFNEQVDGKWTKDQEKVDRIWREKDQVLFHRGNANTDQEIKQEMMLIKRFRNGTDFRTEYVRQGMEAVARLNHKKFQPVKRKGSNLISIIKMDNMKTMRGKIVSDMVKKDKIKDNLESLKRNSIGLNKLLANQVLKVNIKQKRTLAEYQDGEVTRKEILNDYDPINWKDLKEEVVHYFHENVEY